MHVSSVHHHPSHPNRPPNHHLPTKKKQIHTVDAEGTPLDLIFFLPKPHFRQFHLKRFQPGSVHRLAGRVARAKYTGRMTLSHPDAVKGGVEEEAGADVAGVVGAAAGGGGGAMPVEPVYRLTSGAWYIDVERCAAARHGNHCIASRPPTFLPAHQPPQKCT